MPIICFFFFFKTCPRLVGERYAQYLERTKDIPGAIRQMTKEEFLADRAKTKNERLQAARRAKRATKL